mgnify:FL=1
MREILAEAKKYGVKVIPSFDSPGHVDQILRAHPEYGQVDAYGNNYKSGLDVTNPEAIKYIYSYMMNIWNYLKDVQISTSVAMNIWNLTVHLLLLSTSLY